MTVKNEVIVESIPINIRVVELTLVGDTPLIVHRWSEKAKKEMLDKQMKKAKLSKEAKDPMKEYLDCLYYYDRENNKYGFPSIAFKLAAVSAGGRFSDGLKMTELRGAFFVENEFVEIEGTPTMREDMVRIGMGTADIRYRPEFKQWKTKLRIRYNANSISLEQLVSLFNLAGFGVGVGEWRPEKDGQFGMFHVENS
jgi:hypothetical protein